MQPCKSSGRPFDAVMLIAFGGPQGCDEIRPFLDNVLRGRNVSKSRFEKVISHYERFNGVSPITNITMRQAAGLQERLDTETPSLPVYVGMRNWHPFLEDTLLKMARNGVRRALAFPLAAHHSYSSCGQYKQNVVRARKELYATGGPDIELTYVPRWYAHPGFLNANVRLIKQALDNLGSELQAKARVVFTAHSLPLTMANNSRYETELRESADLVAQRLNNTDWALAFQSRSGRPQDPWLEPDICDYLRTERDRGLSAVVISPLGFVADHIEVLYDLDHEAAQVCRKIGLPMQRAATVNDDPLFLDMLADITRHECHQYRGGRPLPIVPTTPPHELEPAPPSR